MDYISKKSKYAQLPIIEIVIIAIGFFVIIIENVCNYYITTRGINENIKVREFNRNMAVMTQTILFFNKNFPFPSLYNQLFCE